MRNHVINKIAELAEVDQRIMLLVGDLGYNVVEKFRDKFPDRFINIGIAEQNMAAVASGLALSGNMVFTYSIGNFATLRAIEQIRNDICYHHANVKILAVGCGFAYGDLGMTHHATEDIAIMRALPNMRVYVPADANEAIQCLLHVCADNEPAYIRMARGGEKELYTKHDDLDVTRMIGLGDISDVVNILTCGTVLSEGIRLKKMLEYSGVKVGVFTSPSVKPIDKIKVQELARTSKIIVTMEDHNVLGGFGGAVAEVMSEIHGTKASLLRVGLQDTYTEIVGDQDYLREYYSIKAEKVLPKVMEQLSFNI